MKYFLLLSLFLTPYAFSHGENKPGPHGGQIRMPGAFHTELLVETHMARVYLLDVNFKNPTTLNSTVSMKVGSDSNFKEVSCSPKVEYFECHIPEVEKVKDIQVKATRNGVSGKLANYPLNKVPPATDDHSQHNH